MLLYGHLIMDCAFDDDRTIVVAMLDFAISAQFGLVYSKKIHSFNSYLLPQF